jgi:hypothetical protein
MIGRLILGAMVAVAAIFGYPDDASVSVKPAAHAAVASTKADATPAN